MLILFLGGGGVEEVALIISWVYYIELICLFFVVFWLFVSVGFFLGGAVNIS